MVCYKAGRLDTLKRGLHVPFAADALRRASKMEWQRAQHITTVLLTYRNPRFYILVIFLPSQTTGSVIL